ncbi:MAG TPA: DNA polymerase III subunit delta [Caldilineae bacterium]|nr:DNA polymerase III subunit delta [Caldilineae bacterium]
MIYLIQGEQEFIRSQRLAEIKARLGPSEMADLNTIELDGARTSLGEIRDVADVIPFLSERRLVIVYGFLRRLIGQGKGEKAAGDPESDALLDYLDHVPEATDLVFVEEKDLPRRHPLVRHLRKLEKEGKARIYECKAPSPRELPRWVQRRAQEKGASITPPAAAALANAIGQDLRLIDVELDKLITYVAGDRAIELADVETMVAYAQTGTIFNLTDAIAEGRARDAFTLLHRLRESGAAPPYLLTMIHRQFRILLQVSELVRAGYPHDQIASRLRLHEFVVDRAIRQARFWQVSDILAAFQLILQTDFAIKTGRLDPDAAIDLLILDLLRRARPSRRAHRPVSSITASPRPL